MDESAEETQVVASGSGQELVLEIENCALELELLRIQLEQHEPSSDSSGRSSPDAEQQQSVDALAAECLGLLESLEKQRWGLHLGLHVVADLAWLGLVRRTLTDRKILRANPRSSALGRLVRYEYVYVVLEWGRDSSSEDDRVPAQGTQSCLQI